jgi:hypothetical protein
MIRNDFAGGFLAQLHQPFRGTVADWAAAGNVRLPHSKRSSSFRLDTAPWIIDPLNAAAETEFVSVCKPTQGSGTTLEEVLLAYTIAAHPRDTHFLAQTDRDAQDIFRKKFLKTLRASPATAPLLSAAGRHDITKDRLELLTMGLAVHGPGLNSLQSDSVEVLLLDEAWRYPAGTILEIIERTSTVEATRRIVAVSQAGEEHQDRHGNATYDDWGGWFHRGTQELYNVRCPACGTYYFPETSHFRAADGSRDILTKEWNWQMVRDTAHHVTPCCEHIIANTPENRRNLSSSGRYIQTNFNAAPRHRSFRYNCWVVYWQDWGGNLEQFCRAQDALKLGDTAPLKIWTQKKESAWWRLEQSIPPVVRDKPASGYRIETYERTKEATEAPKIENEERRFLCADMQSDRFPLIIRAFSLQGSRLLLAEEVKSFEEIKALGIEYGIPSTLCGLDVGNWRAEALRACVENRFTPLRGRDTQNFTKQTGGRKKPARIPYQAVLERLTGDAKYHGKTVKVHEFSNPYYKDLFSRLRAMPEHQIPDDVPQEYLEAMESERKNPATGIYKRIGNRANHYWDAEIMCTFMASLYRLVGSVEPEGSDSA